MDHEKTKLEFPDQLALWGVVSGFALAVGFGLLPTAYLDYIPDRTRLWASLASLIVAGASFLFFLFHFGRANKVARLAFYAISFGCILSAAMFSLSNQSFLVRALLGALVGAITCACAPLIYQKANAENANDLTGTRLASAEQHRELNEPTTKQIPPSAAGATSSSKAEPGTPTASQSTPVNPGGGIGILIEGGNNNTFNNVRVRGMANPIIQRNSSGNTWENVDISAASAISGIDKVQLDDAKNKLIALGRKTPIKIVAIPNSANSYPLAEDILKYLIDENCKLSSHSVIVKDLTPAPDHILTLTKESDGYTLVVVQPN